MWAKRFADKTPDQISFDLVNEPCTREDMNDQFSERGPVPGQLYREVAKFRIIVRHGYLKIRMMHQSRFGRVQLKGASSAERIWKSFMLPGLML